MDLVHNVSKRPEGKIPTTKVTNELADAVNGMLPKIQQGQPKPTPISGSSSVKYTVKQYGGSAGGSGVFCSFTYDIFDYGADTATATKLAHDIALTGNGNRIAPWTMDTNASIGEGFFDDDGTFILTWVDERAAGYKDCPDPAP